MVLAFVGGCASPMSTLQGRFEMSNGHRPRASIQNTIVYLVSDKPEAVPASQSTATLYAETGGLHPALIAVAAGTQVTIRNKDDVYHQVFSISPEQPFDVGAMSPGEKRSVVFGHPGAIHVFCELHPNESAYIYVTPTQYYTRADANGHFHLAGVPPGSYTLHTWNPDVGETSQAIVVPRHGELAVTVGD